MVGDFPSRVAIALLALLDHLDLQDWPAFLGFLVSLAPLDHKVEKLITRLTSKVLAL